MVTAFLIKISDGTVLWSFLAADFCKLNDRSETVLFFF